jgi:hypothetical protein
LGGFYAAAPVRLGVNSFYGTKRTTAKPPVDTTSAYFLGWHTLIYYRVYALCGGEVTIPVSVNESFGERTPSTSQWGMPVASNGVVIPFADQMAVNGPQPGSVQPFNPWLLITQLVDQYPWTVRLGSTTSGSGLHMLTDDTLRYLDHGDHSSDPE